MAHNSKKTDNERYYRNKKKRIDAKLSCRRKNRQLAKNYTFDYLKSHSCIDCGEGDPIVLEFDHVRGEKKLGVAKMVAEGYSLATVINEISKCEVRCANCHRRKTALQFGWNKHGKL